MNRHVTAVLCGLALAGASLAQDSTNKPSATWPAKETHRQASRGLETRPVRPSLLPMGTAMRFRLEHSLSTSKNHVGDKFYGRITESVKVNDRTVVPAGSTVTGFIDRSTIGSIPSSMVACFQLNFGSYMLSHG